MTNPYLDQLPNPFLDELKNPFELQDPLSAKTMDQATDILATNTRDFFQRNPLVTSTLGTVGKVLQPFAAPQQILFAGIRAGRDLFDGEDETNAWETMKRGGRSALAYATYQGGRDLPGMLKNTAAPDPTIKPITGYELFKGTGAPNWVARWGGTAADFLLDVPLVGAVGKAAKVDKLTAGLKIGENMARSFDSPASLRAFVGGVAASPFTTQPIKRIVEAVPQGLRQQAGQAILDPLLNLRITPRSESAPVSPTLGQTLFSRNQNVPEEVVGFLDNKNAVMSQFAVLHNEALSGFDRATRGLDFKSGKELGVLVGRLADESDPGLRAGIEGQIKALETRTGRVGLFDDAIQAANKGIQFDVFGAEKLTARKLMSEEALKAYQQGDKRHLRRVYHMYGERAEDQLRRLIERDAGASVAFDDVGLMGLYGATLNPVIPPSPPIAAFAKSGITSSRVADFPSRTPLLDPVKDAEKLVWRDVARDVEIGTVDRGGLDLGNMDMSDITRLRNIVGWDAVKQVGGKWKMQGVSDVFPIGHPVIQELFGDLKAQGGVTDIRVENRSFKEQVPNYFDPRTGAPKEAQRAWADQEIADAGGALYIHTKDVDAFMGGATEAETAAFLKGLENFPLRERTRQVGKNTVEDGWFPIDPTDPALARLLERANGGEAALFDGVTGQPALATNFAIKSSPNVPSPKDFAAAVQRAYLNPDQHPADFLKAFFTEKGMGENHIARILEGIGNDWAKKAGIVWRPADAEIVRHFTRQRAANGGGEGLGVRNTTAVTSQRQEISDLYADVLGEVEDFTTRITKQAKVVPKAVTVNGVVQDIRGYLTANNLIERIGTADMGAIHKTAGLRVINAEQARQLGNGFTEGEVIPAEIHRILLEQVNTRKDAPLGLAWQWYSSRWQGVKLANPASILTNLKSTFVMADQAGHNPLELMRGMGDYLRLHKAAQRGDGAMDVGANVNGVTMRELFNNGAFTHNTLMNTEVIQQSSRLMDELANPAGNTLQQKIAALQSWLTETEQGAKVAGGYATAVTPMRWLGDMYGRVDSLAKGGLYMTLRKKGMKPEQAARIADETFFNYQNVPYVVDGLRRFGLLGMPFASFKFLAAGRFMRSMYQNPYGVEKYYRLGNSSKAALNDQQEQDGKNSLAAYEEGSPDYVRRGLYIPMGRDSEGRQRAVRMDDILPESAVFDAFNADGVAGTIPPAVAMAAQIVTGKGYQGRDTYRTGQSWAETSRLDPQDAVRGVVASLWQFGAYPWAPGQPMTERIVKAIAAKSVPVETIADPKAQAVLKLLSEGPAAPFDQQVWSAEKKGSQPVPDVADALARLLGVKSYPITTTTSEPGSMRSNKQGLEADLKVLDTMMNSEMRQAATNAQRQEIQQRYAQKRAPILQKLRGQ